MDIRFISAIDKQIRDRIKLLIHSVETDDKWQEAFEQNNFKLFYEEYYGRYSSTDNNAITGFLLACGISIEEILKNIDVIYERMFKGIIFESGIDINFPSHIKSIGTEAFMFTKGISTLDMHECSTMSIASDAIYWADIKQLVLAPGLKCLNGGSIRSIDAKEIYIPDNCKYLVEESIVNCSKLNWVSVPKNIKIDDSAFSGCAYLTTLEYRGTKEEFKRALAFNDIQSEWNRGSLINKVECNDGPLEIRINY